MKCLNGLRLFGFHANDLLDSVESGKIEMFAGVMCYYFVFLRSVQTSISLWFFV